MDRTHGKPDSSGSYVTPALMSLKIDMADSQFFETMKNIEKALWDYLDTRYQGQIVPRHLNLKAYMQHVSAYHNLDWTTKDIANYCRNYDRFKKTIPTAGIILHCNEHIVVVQMRQSLMWCMPKGKQESGEKELRDTAVREFREETGVDLDDDVTEQTSSVYINKTKFYVVEADHMQRKFSGYDHNEIAAVRWASIDEILTAKAETFSRQVQESAIYLKSKEYYEDDEAQDRKTKTNRNSPGL